MSVIQVLSATTHKLRIVVDANATTNESRCTVNYSKQTATVAHTGLTAVLSATTGTTAVDLIGPPGASEEWSIANIVIWNRDTVDHTYTIYLDVSGTQYNLYTAQSVKAGKSTILAVGGSSGSSSGGGITGPASSTNLAIATWSGTAGDTLLNNSNATISSGVISSTAKEVTGTGGNGFLGIVAQSSDAAAPAATGLRLEANASGYLAWILKNGSDTYRRAFIGALTANRDYTLPDASGALALSAYTGNYEGCDLRMSLSSTDPYDYNTSAGTHLYIHPIRTGNVDVLVSSVKTTINVASYIDINLATASGGSPVTGSKVYDVFVYESSGAIAAEVLVWTNDTTRATALADNSTLGYWVKSGATTRRYIGSFYTDSGGGACTAKVNILHLQNAMNRKNIQVDCFTGATRASVAYTTASNSYVAVNDTTIGSSRLSWVQGLPEPDLIVGWDIKSFSGVYSPYYNYAGISIDGAAPVNDTYGSNSGAIITYYPMQIPLMCPSTAGRHYADKQFHTSSSTASITDNGFLGRYTA